MPPSEPPVVPAGITRAAVIGSGVMGSGIAQVLATAGVTTVLVDREPSQLDRAHQLIREGRYGLDRGVQRGKLSRTTADAALARLRFTSDPADAADAADIVIEAIPERLDLKITLFRQLDAITAPETVLASNSSGLSIAAMAAATDRPGRVIGWHWASPPVVQRLAEIVRGRATTDATVETVTRLARACGKNPVVVRESDRFWGYAANRILYAMIAEADRVVAEGVATREQVDTVMRDAYGWPTGPYALLGGAKEGWGEGWAGSAGRRELSSPTAPRQRGDTPR